MSPVNKTPRSHALGSGAAILALFFAAASCTPPEENTGGEGGAGGTKTGGGGGTASGGSGGSKTGGSGGGSPATGGGGGSTPTATGGSGGGSPAGGSGGSTPAGGSGGGSPPAGGSGGSTDTGNVTPPTDTGNTMPPPVGAGGFGPTCMGEPAATPPGLKKTPVTALPGGVQAGQVAGVPGESRIYIVGHKNGQIYTFDNGMQSPMEGAKVSVATGGNNEQGLLSMAFHPKNKNTFYLFYTAAGNGRIVIDEFERTSPTAATKKGEFYSHAGSNQFHNGGSIYFNPKDETPFIYSAHGDAQGRAGSAAAAQGTNGRILKIDTTNKMATTVHYNIRNPYRMSIDRLTGDMWIGNVSGPPGGKIYFAAHGKASTNWGHDSAENSITGQDGSGNAIVGGVAYRGTKIAGLCGRYFFGQHNNGAVKSLVQKGGMREGGITAHASLTSGGLASFGEDGAGEIYLSTLGGQVFRIDAQ